MQEVHLKFIHCVCVRVCVNSLLPSITVHSAQGIQLQTETREQLKADRGVDLCGNSSPQWISVLQQHRTGPSQKPKKNQVGIPTAFIFKCTFWSTAEYKKTQKQIKETKPTLHIISSHAKQSLVIVNF